MDERKKLLVELTCAFLVSNPGMAGGAAVENAKTALDRIEKSLSVSK